MSNDTCKFLENGRCDKMLRRGKCKPSGRGWLESVEENDGRFIAADRICEHSSLFGNFRVGLTLADIERIKNGEILYIRGEYSIFIGLQNES